jgi:hypothetical protein
MRPGDAGYNRTALDACVDELTAGPAGIEVESSWTLSDGFCVVYRYSHRLTEQFGYCARTVPAAEFAEPAEWGEGEAVELWEGPPPAETLLFDTLGIGWRGALGADPPPRPTDL